MTDTPLALSLRGPRSPARLAGALLALLALGLVSACDEGGGDSKPAAGLAGLQLASEKSSGVEPYSITLDQPFAADTLAYTVTVETSLAKAVYVTLTARSEGDVLTINGARAWSGIPFTVPLVAGNNAIAIDVTTAAGEKTTYSLDVTQADLGALYKVEQLQAGVWRISDFNGFPGNEDTYLIEGTERALLIDTGMGKGDLAGLVKSLTKLPVVVAITHGHGDHIGQLSQFADATTVYMSAGDRGSLPKTMSTANFQWIEDGDTFNLGAADEDVKVIAVPGHSAGSVMFLYPKAKVLAIGDAIGSGSYVWMFFSQFSLSSYAAALRHLEGELAGYDALTFLAGHHWQERVPLRGAAGLQLVHDMRTVTEQVVKGEVVGGLHAVKFGPTMEMQFRSASYGLAGLWYSPSWADQE